MNHTKFLNCLGLLLGNRPTTVTPDSCLYNIELKRTTGFSMQIAKSNSLKVIRLLFSCCCRSSTNNHALYVRHRNVMKTTQDVLCVISYFKPNLTPYQRALASCWTSTKRVLCHEIVLTASFLLRTIRYGWWLVRFPLEKCAGFARTATVFYERAAPDRNEPSETLRDETDGDGVKCEVLYDPGPGSALMDVVFIHGLRGDKLKTWKQGVWKQQVGQSPEPVVVRSCGGRRAGLSAAIDQLRLDRLATDEHIKEFTDCWPRDWLPLDCPYVRVIAISYSTDPYLWRPIWLRKPVR